MSKINVGFYLKPHIWVGDIPKQEAPTELSVVKENIAPGINIAVQRQGLVLASIETVKIPDYVKSDAYNTLRSESASFVLNFLNAFSFALYEAQLNFHKGAFHSVPQEIRLEDLYLWPEVQGTLLEVNLVQPIAICTGEFNTLEENVKKDMRTMGMLDLNDRQFRLPIPKEAFTHYLDERLLSPRLITLFSILNRGIASIRGASFDVALVNFWTVIELIMKDLWSDFLGNKSLTGKRKAYLTGRDITASLIAENLNLHGLISNSLYEKISEARRCRNKLMHELKPIKPRICHLAFETVKELIQIQHSINIFHPGSFFMGNVPVVEVRE